MSPYGQRWQVYRRFRRDLLLVSAGFFPWVLGVGVLAALVVSHRLSAVFGVVAACLYAFFLGVVFIRMEKFRCPRCGGHFASSRWYTKSIFARKCVHCGLRKFGEDASRSERSGTASGTEVR